jgi:hypothetical protein
MIAIYVQATYHEAVLAVGVLETKFVVVDHGGVECSDWSG